MTMVREEKLDLVLVPLAGYHLWLLYTIRRHPTRTVIGRQRHGTQALGVRHDGHQYHYLPPDLIDLHSDIETELTDKLIFHHGTAHQNTEKNGVLAVQTLRNNIMASTVLATTAITLVSVISVFVGVT
jgi:hypothetical protein